MHFFQWLAPEASPRKEVPCPVAQKLPFENLHRFSSNEKGNPQAQYIHYVIVKGTPDTSPRTETFFDADIRSVSTLETITLLLERDHQSAKLLVSRNSNRAPALAESSAIPAAKPVLLEHSVAIATARSTF